MNFIQDPDHLLTDEKFIQRAMQNKKFHSQVKVQMLKDIQLLSKGKSS